MATGAVGHIEEFRLDVEYITTYIERMELYFIANDIADAKKAAVLLTCIGGKTYRIVKFYSLQIYSSSLLRPEGNSQAPFRSQTLYHHRAVPLQP